MFGLTKTRSESRLLDERTASKQLTSTASFIEQINGCICSPRSLVVILILSSFLLAIHILRNTKQPTSTSISLSSDDDIKGFQLAQSSYVSERPWKEMPPSWCGELIANPLERPRTSSVYDCRRGRFGAICEDGKPRFFSQYNQDIWTWTEHWRYLNRRGVYVDIAANEPVRISNTYFYDRCLHWKGLCIEPHPDFHPLIVKMRSCGVLNMCVSNKPENVTFQLDGGSSGVLETNKNLKARKSLRSLNLRCIRTSTALSVANIDVVDLLSLDVEGHEFFVLSGIDWNRTKINLIVLESLSNETQDLLRRLRYRLAPQPKTKSEKLKPGVIFSDHVFLHPDVVWGKPQ